MNYWLAGVGLWIAVAAGAATIESYGPFDIYYYDVGEVWNGATNTQAWTATQQADIHSAIDEWDRVINNAPARQINMHVMWNTFDGTTLGGSSSYLLSGTDGGGQQTIWTGSELAWREAHDAGNTWDTFIRYDVDAAGMAWNFGEAGPGAGEIDFRSVILHEIGHSLGWLTSYNSTSDDFGYGGYGLTSYERFLVDGSGNAALNGGTGTPDNFNELDAPVFFSGYNATNFYGGLVPIYAPGSYEAGSSLSHLDETTFGNTLMTPYIANGQSTRSISDLEIAMMTDMGWDVIPEPSTLVILLMSGAGFLGIRRFFLI